MNNEFRVYIAKTEEFLVSFLVRSLETFFFSLLVTIIDFF